MRCAASTSNGKRIDSPKFTLQGNEHDSITEQFCQDWVDTTKDGTNFLQKGSFDAVDKSLENGVVLVMSLWDDHFANMLWLDSIYPTDSTDPTNYRGSCSIDSGLAADVEADVPHSNVIFSNIKWGKIGTTTSGAGPAPTPPSPSDCTSTGADPYATGSHVACCSGSAETLVHDATWHYICKATSQIV
jgi:cellulose 1,4-beta-cellobiosidase